MSTETTVLPPNTTFLTTVNVTSSGTSSKTQPTIQPLPPDNVSATLNHSIITVQVTVYIDAADNLTSLDIYKGNTVTNGLLKVYIDYNYPEEVPVSLNTYTFSFQIPDTNNNITTIESYLWDEDPIGSRGTITEVTGG
ncbi:hypothetical protein MHTCC0001_25540 [Flavobacteriaceae bacterium MHTCC 0001]